MDGAAGGEPVKARLLDGDKAVVLDVRGSGMLGEWLFELPSDLPLRPDSMPYLEVAAQDQEDLAPLRTQLRMLEPAYRTHLVTDKSVYRAGETIYFRSLTLERFGLEVPQSAFA